MFALSPFDRAGSAAHRWPAEHGAEAWLITIPARLVMLLACNLPVQVLDLAQP